ncbi:MAG: hypothetical protein II852_08905 [Bacteroidales bacterium]|nr:hypothetical protein [Bacteroidales bacterium]
MSTILYTQNENPTVLDSIVIQGKTAMPFSSDNNEHIEAVRLLNSATNWLKITPENTDGNLRCYRSDKGIYIQSNYLEKDNVGRLMMFRFYTESVDLDSACNFLKEVSSQINRHCNPQEITSLLRRKSVNNNSFILYRNKLIDENGNVVSPEDDQYNHMVSKFESNKNFKVKKSENGFYFLKPKKIWNPWDSDKIYFIQSIFDDDFKFWIENPQDIDDTIRHLNNLSKYFDKSVSDSVINNLKNKSNYGK